MKGKAMYTQLECCECLKLTNKMLAEEMQMIIESKKKQLIALPTTEVSKQKTVKILNIRSQSTAPSEQQASKPLDKRPATNLKTRTVL